MKKQSKLQPKIENQNPRVRYMDARERNKNEKEKREPQGNLKKEATIERNTQEV